MATVSRIDGEPVIWFDDTDAEKVMSQHFGSPLYVGIMGIDTATALYVAGCRVVRPSSVREEWITASGKQFFVSFELEVSLSFMDHKEALSLLRILGKAKLNPCGSAIRMTSRNKVERV